MKKEMARGTTISDQVSDKPIWKIFPESEPNREKSGKTPGNPEELKKKDCRLMISKVEKEEDEDESLLTIGEEWIKIGDEFSENPVAISPLQVIKENIATDSSFQSGQKKQRKRKFEAENQEDALFLNPHFVPDLQTEIPKNSLTKHHSQNLECKYVQLHVINRRFLSPTDELEEEEHLASPFSFRTKRRYLYK